MQAEWNGESAARIKSTGGSGFDFERLIRSGRALYCGSAE